MSISVADLLCDLKVQIEGLREKKTRGITGGGYVQNTNAAEKFC